jgi:uncharacterized membrane protein YeaQ/YmgE (transglycosylase-associated protein family)
LIFFLIISAGVGLLIGALARLALPGPDPMSWLMTLAYGMGGSILGGLLARLIHVPSPFDFVAAVALAAALIWYFTRRRTAGASPAPGPGEPKP